MRSPASALVLGPLDRLRLGLLRSTMPASSFFAGRRAERVAAIGVVSMLVALVTTSVVPLWMLALGPIVLGVPHLLADLRYCVVRPGWHRRPALWIGVGLPLLWVALSSDPAVGFAAVAGACAATDGPRWRRILGIALAGVGALACMLAGAVATLVLVHAHNLVAVLLWWRWRDSEREARRLRSLPILAFVLGMLLIAGGGLDQGIGALARRGPLGLELDHQLAALTGGLDGVLGLRLVLLFCFAQSVHYLIWLRLVPEDDRDRPTPRSFAASWSALRSELGPIVPWLAVLAALGLGCWALLDLAAARIGYLRAAQFHVFLELGVLAWIFVGGRRFALDSRALPPHQHEETTCN